MKQRLFTLVLMTLMLTAPAAWADGILPYAGGDSWSSWNTADLGPARYGTNHFWNNSSNDSGECNIGYWMSGTPGCTVPEYFGDGFHYGYYDASPALVPPDYFGTGADTFFFEPTGQTVEVTMGVQIAKWARTGENTLGWFQLDGLGGGVLFNSGFDSFGNQITNVGNRVSFSPTGAWGLYITSPRGTFATTTIDGVTGANHFAAFRVDPVTGRYIIGVEDNVIGQGGDFDFNDVIVEIRNVPEPGTLLLLALGVGGFAATARRRQKK